MTASSACSSVLIAGFVPTAAYSLMNELASVMAYSTSLTQLALVAPPT